MTTMDRVLLKVVIILVIAYLLAESKNQNSLEVSVNRVVLHSLPMPLYLIRVTVLIFLVFILFTSNPHFQHEIDTQDIRSTTTV